MESFPTHSFKKKDGVDLQINKWKEGKKLPSTCQGIAPLSLLGNEESSPSQWISAPDLNTMVNPRWHDSKPWCCNSQRW
jgi:hypothetical protein